MVRILTAEEVMARTRDLGAVLLDAVEGGASVSFMAGFSQAEAEAKARGRTLLTFDTMAGSAAEKLYLGLGYVRVGEIPRYALYPDGTGPAATAILYKLLA